MSVVAAVPLVALAAFLASGVYYGVLGSRLARLSPAYAGPRRPPGTTAIVELVRNAVLSVVCAVLVAHVGTGGPAVGFPPEVGSLAVGSAVLLALALWIAFPVVVLTGSVYHERVPASLALIHSGDWALKLAIIVVGLAALT